MSAAGKPQSQTKALKYACHTYSSSLVQSEALFPDLGWSVYENDVMGPKISAGLDKGVLDRSFCHNLYHIAVYRLHRDIKPNEFDPI